ncbi:MAG: TetR/AcrR family transcriptional regulator [Holophagales bacterium]|nr:TetR/AcrR family transcriptional regulator [Holophagales bacterium]
MMNDNSSKPRPRGPKPVRIDPSQLLDAAQRVFARDGVDGGSVRAIAREAKCDPSLLYYHFENKEAIFVAILEQKFNRFIPDLENISRAYSAHNTRGARQGAKGTRPINEFGRTPLQEAFWQMIKTFRKNIQNDASFRGMMRNSVATNHSFAQNKVMNYVLRVIQIVQKLLSDGMESGELRGDINLYITTFFFLRTCVEILDFFPVLNATLISMPLEEAIDLAEKQWFRLFWRGIANDSNPDEESL